MADNQFDQRILELVNNERASAGLDPLAIDNQLDRAANLHTDEMAQAEFMSHQLPGKAGLGERISATGYDWTRATQSIAAGYTTPEGVVGGWLNSPGNRENILNPEFTEIGIGYNNTPDRNSSDYDTYWTQIFASSNNNSTPQNNGDANIETDNVESSRENTKADEPQFNPQNDIEEVNNSAESPETTKVNANNYDQRVLALVNQERAAAGLDGLAIDSQLDLAADLHTNEMVQADRMSHRLPGEAELEDRVRATGYSPSRWGENVAAGYATPEAVLDSWMDSPGHRRNILDPKFTEIGIGYENAPDDIPNSNDTDIYWTQVFGAESVNI